MGARHYRRVGRVPLVRGGTSAPLRARLRLLGESDSTKRHRQRQHERHHQQRDALPHLFSPPLPLAKTKTGLPPWVRDSRLRHWLPVLLGAHPSTEAGFLASILSQPIFFV